TAGSFLDRNNVAVLGQINHDINRDFFSSAARHIVQHDGQTEIGHGTKVTDQAFAAGLIVIRSNLERRICSGGLGVLGQFNRLVGGIGSGAGDDLDPLLGNI